jgi:hypothetical protein
MPRFTPALRALVILVAVLTLAACGGDDDEAAGNGEVAVELAEQNDSGQSGTATLAPTDDGQTSVTLELSDQPDVPQPAHIHAGTCEELGEVVHPLTNVEDGSSETTVDVSIDELQDGEFAINAHESEQNIANYVACGPIE